MPSVISQEPTEEQAKAFMTMVADACIISMLKKGLDVKKILDVGNRLVQKLRTDPNDKTNYMFINKLTLALSVNVIPCHTVEMALEDEEMLDILKEDMNSRDIRDLWCSSTF